MAKYSVNAVEIIKDDASVDWSRIAGKPAPLLAGINTTNRALGQQSGKFRRYDLEDDGTGRLRLVQITYNCDDATSNCNCPPGG